MSEFRAFKDKLNLASIAAAAGAAVIGALAFTGDQPAVAATPRPDNFHYYQKVIKRSGGRLIAGLDVTASTDHDPNETGGESIIFPRSTRSFGIVRKSLNATSKTYKPFLNNDGTAFEWGFKKTPAVLSVEFIIPRDYRETTFCIEGSARLSSQTSLEKEEVCWDMPK